MQESRLFRIVYYLLEKGKTTAPELAEKFEVSVRTIYRDLDTISSAGIPIYATQGKGGGICIQENFVLNKSLFSEQEQNQLLMALQGLEILDDKNTEGILSKLNSIFRRQNYNWIEIDFADWRRDSDCNFHLLKSAIFQRERVTFLYYGMEAQPSERLVDPLKLVYKSRDWYLYAYCHLREDYRLFKLTRIKELSLTDQSFSRQAPERVFRQIDLHGQRTMEVTLLFKKEMGYRVYDHFDRVTVTKEGDFLAVAVLPQNESSYNFLLSLGSGVKVLSPQSVQKEVIARIKLMEENYIT